MNKFEYIFDITDMGILKDALKCYGRIWQSDFYYQRRIKDLYIYLGFSIDDFNDLKAAYSFDDIINRVKIP